jgi:ribosomal protein S27AE
MTERAKASTTTGHDPGNLRELSSCKGQHRTPPHSDRSAKVHTALVDKHEKKNVHCPRCGAVVRYHEVRPGSGNLIPACENPHCSLTIDNLRKTPEPMSNDIRLRQWHKFGRRC